MKSWIKIHEEKDLKHLHKKAKESIHSVEVYENINDQIIDNFGASKEFLNKLKLKIDIELMKIENKAPIFIEIKQEELNQLEEIKKDETTFYDIIFNIEKNMGFKININELTVFEFYNYCKQFNKK